MKANEIKLKEVGYLFGIHTVAAGRRYKKSMSWGCVFPTTAAQAATFIKTGGELEVLNMDAVLFIERELAPYGFAGVYKYTKSHNWVRLVNINDVYAALKIKYSLPDDLEQRFYENSKVRSSVDEILAEIPRGVRRYSVFYYTGGSSTFSPDVSYDYVIQFVESKRDHINLRQVKTIRTPRTFSIQFAMELRR